MFFSGLPYGRVWLCVLAKFSCLLTSLWDVIDILNMYQNCSKDKLFLQNAVTGIMGTRQLPLFLTYVFSCLLSNNVIWWMYPGPIHNTKKTTSTSVDPTLWRSKIWRLSLFEYLTPPPHPPPPHSLPNIITALFQHTQINPVPKSLSRCC